MVNAPRLSTICVALAALVSLLVNVQVLNALVTPQIPRTLAHRKSAASQSPLFVVLNSQTVQSGYEALASRQQQQQNATENDAVPTEEEDTDLSKVFGGPPDVDSMRARAGVLRVSILRKQLELQELEREILCCSRGGSNAPSADNGFLHSTMEAATHSLSKLSSSTNVLLRKLTRVHKQEGPRNRQWKNVGEYVQHQTKTGIRIVKGLVDNPERLTYLVDPETPSLVPHVPAILTRLDKLEDHVAPILERVLNNRRHLASVEPYLDEIMERFDDIEPHLPWILDNIDTLAPYTGLLLKHIDELLIYADADAHEMSKGTRYDLAEQLLPFLEYYVSKLDVVGPHLPLLRPHVPLLLKHNRIAKVSPHIDRLFARGYSDLSASANMDVLLFWFGWTLRIPGLPRLFFALPWSPRIVSFLANRLPKRFVRGYCSGISCTVDENYGSFWNNLVKS